MQQQSPPTQARNRVNEPLHPDWKRLLLLSGLMALLALPTMATAELLSEIQQRGVLRVCIWPDYYRISYRNPRTGILEGIDIDMARELSEDLEVDLQFIDSSFAQLKQNLQNGQCDIAMHGVGVREDRRQAMDFSEAHLRSGIYAVVEKSHPGLKQWQDLDQPGNIIVVQKGTYMEPVMQDYLQQAQLSVVDNFKAREQAVMSGRADAFMTDYPYGQRMVQLSGWGNLLSPKTPLAPTPYAYAVPKYQPQWLKRVNQFVAAIKQDGRLRQAAKTHNLLPIVAP